MGLIYLLKVDCGNKQRILVGQTRQTLAGRIRSYKWSLKHNKKSNPKLQNCYNKYGWAAFQFSQLEQCRNEDMPERERYYISKFNSFKSDLGLNLTSGGEEGKVLSSESRRRIGDKHRGKTISLEQRKKLSAARQGKKPFLGKTHTEDTKNKIAFSLGVFPFALTTPSNGTTLLFKTKSEAEKVTGISRRTLSRMIEKGGSCRGWTVEK